MPRPCIPLAKKVSDYHHNMPHIYMHLLRSYLTTQTYTLIITQSTISWTFEGFYLWKWCVWPVCLCQCARCACQSASLDQPLPTSSHWYPHATLLNAYRISSISHGWNARKRLVAEWGKFFPWMFRRSRHGCLISTDPPQWARSTCSICTFALNTTIGLFCHAFGV